MDDNSSADDPEPFIYFTTTRKHKRLIEHGWRSLRVSSKKWHHLQLTSGAHRELLSLDLLIIDRVSDLLRLHRIVATQNPVVQRLESNTAFFQLALEQFMAVDTRLIPNGKYKQNLMNSGLKSLT